MKRELVVAHHSEDLGWLQSLSDWTQTVYHKGPGGTENRLPNVGREAHTYLHHIVERYASLADVTVFSQGNPADHIDDPAEALRRLQKYAGEIGYFDLGTMPLVDDGNGNPSHAGLALREIFARIFKRTPPEFFAFRAGANFAVSRETIHQHPRAFYRRLLDESLSPLGPWELERIWPHVFPSVQPTSGIVMATDAGSFQDFSFCLLSLLEWSKIEIEVFDLGLSDRQRKWCRGFKQVTLRAFPTLGNKLDRLLKVKMWQTWLKPFYLLASRFDRVLWIDADCLALADPGELLTRIESGPVLFTDRTAAIVANRSGLEDVFPVSPRGENVPIRANAGVVGLDRARDHELLATWAWAVQWVARNRRFQNLFRWYDQGALIWSIQHLGLNQIVADDPAWNVPYLHESDLLSLAVATDRSLIELLHEELSGVKLVHFLGDFKLSERLRHAIKI